MQKNSEQYMSIGEAADHLGVSIDTLRRWAKKGKVSTYRSPGRHRYFKRSDLDQVFGTRYEREEKITDVSNLPLAKDQEQIANVQRQYTKNDNSHSAQAQSIEEPPPQSPPSPEELTIPDFSEPAPPPTSPNTTNALNIPRYIRSQRVSKYSSLLNNISFDGHSLLSSPHIAGKLEDKILQTPTPVLLPKKEDQISQKLITRIRVEEVLDENPPQSPPLSNKQALSGTQKSQSSAPKLESFLRRAFLAFLAIDLVLFVFWWIENRLTSPVL